MTIPFRVKKLTPTAKLPERANEGDLWDLFADKFDIDFTEEWKYGKRKSIEPNGKNSEEIFDEISDSILLYPQNRILVKTGVSIQLPIKHRFSDKQDDKVFFEPWDFETEFHSDTLESHNVKIMQYAVADIRPRSGLALKHGITVLNAPGTIDNSYRKEIGVIIYNAGHEAYTIKKGDKIAQMLIRPLYPSNFEVVEEFEDTGRGGFGSTGK